MDSIAPNLMDYKIAIWNIFEFFFIKKAWSYTVLPVQIIKTYACMKALFTSMLFRKNVLLLLFSALVVEPHRCQEFPI